MRTVVRWSLVAASGLSTGLLAVNGIGSTTDPPAPASIELDTSRTRDDVRPLAERRERQRAAADRDEVAERTETSVVRPNVISGGSEASASASSADSPSAPAVASVADPETADSAGSADGAGSADSVDSTSSIDSGGSADS